MISDRTKVKFYQWLLRRQGPAVARRGWFVYATGRRDLPAFGDRLEFRVKLLPYDGDDAWVEPTVVKIRETLAAPQPPAPTEGCAYCAFAQKAARA